MRKLHSRVSKSTAKPGRKIRLFACHSRSVCVAYVNVLMTYPLCAKRVHRGMQKHVDRQVGNPIDAWNEHFDWMYISLAYAFHKIYKYILNTFRPLNLMIAIGMWRYLFYIFVKTITYCTFKLGGLLDTQPSTFCLFHKKQGQSHLDTSGQDHRSTHKWNDNY